MSEKRAKNCPWMPCEAEIWEQESLLAAALIFPRNAEWREAVAKIDPACWHEDHARDVALAVVGANGNGQNGTIGDVWYHMLATGSVWDGTGEYLGRLVGVQPSCCASLSVERIQEYWSRREFIRKRHIAASALSAPELAVSDARTFLGDLDLFDSEIAPQAKRGGLNELLEAAITGKRKPVRLPWKELNQNCHALMPGTVTVVCGNPGCGKSFALLEIAYEAFLAGVKVALYELEDDRAFHLLRLLAILDRNPDLTDLEWVEEHPVEAIGAKDRHIETLNAFARCIQDSPDGQPDMDDLSRWIAQQARNGARVIIVDPITVADQGNEPWRTASAFMVQCASVMTQYGSSLIIAAHPKKGSADFPRLEDVAGGSSFTRRAQSVLWLERHDDDHEANVTFSNGYAGQEKVNRTAHVLKARNCKGQGAKIAMRFRDDSLRFEELGIENRGKKAKYKASMQEISPFNPDDEMVF